MGENTVILTNTVRDPEEIKPKYGLVDGGTIHLECSVCAKPLLDVTITRPGFKFADGTPLEGNYMAKCPYCQNYSDKHFISGGIATTMIARKDHNGNDVVVSFLKDFDINQDGTTVFNIQLTGR